MNRRQLRAPAAAWLLCQLLSLAAFAQSDCCRLHAHEAARAEVQHDAQPACHRPAERPRDKCRMSSACQGPAAALLSVLANHGVLTDLALQHADPASSEAAAIHAVRLLRLSITPDSPPPRA